MKRIYLLLSMAACSALVNSQSLKLDQLDFSRFPSCDIFLTSSDVSKSKKLDTTLFSQFKITQNGKLVIANSLKSVMELKAIGESELFIALVADNSFSMNGKTEIVEDALGKFIDSLQLGDQVSIFDFGDGDFGNRVNGIAEPLKAKKRITFSSAKPILKKYIKYNDLTASTYIYDVVYYSLLELSKTDVLGRRVAILFSDGEDNGSTILPRQIIALARLNNIPVYCIDLNTSENRSLKEISSSTGGQYYFVREIEDLNNLYQNVLKILKSQYRLSYETPLENIQDSVFKMSVTHNGAKVTKDEKVFTISGEKQNYYSLIYLERSGKIKLENYVTYLTKFPSSKYEDAVLLNLGRFWKQRGDYAKAIAVFNRVLRDKMSSLYRTAQLEKADIFNLSNSYKEAQLIYNDILKSGIEPDIRSQAMLDLAKSYQNEGNSGLALQTYLNVVKDFEGTENASYSLYQAALLNLQNDNPKKAKEALTTILADYPASKVALFAKTELAKVYLSEGYTELAEKLFNEVIRETADPDIKIQSMLQLAESQVKSKNYLKAVALYKEIIALSPAQAQTLNLKDKLITALFLGGQYIEAVNMYSSLSEPEKESAISRFGDIDMIINNNVSSGLVDGSALLKAPGEKISNYLSLTESKELADNFPIDKRIYSVKNITSPKMFMVPFYSQEKKTDATGVYFYEKNVWKPLLSNFNSEYKTFEFTAEQNGIYAILVKQPKVITLFNIYFDFGKSNIKKEAEVNLFSLIDDLKSLPLYSLDIIGHTDSSGTEEDNLNLSIERAKSVKYFMVKSGIDSLRLSTKGYGESAPLVPNDSPENMQKNRRTEFIFLMNKDATVTQYKTNVRYTVLFKAYETVKDAFDNKRFYQMLGYSPAVLVDPSNLKQQYKLILGVFATRSEAEALINKFTSEFKGIELQIIEETYQ